MNLRIAIVGGACGAVAGCTSLLGDYTSSNVGAASDGGVGDGGFDATQAADGPGPQDSSQPETTTIADAAGDVSSDAAAGPMPCTTWRYSSPLVLETLSAGSRQIDGNIRVFPLTGQQAGQIRIVATKGAGLPPFTVYTVDPSQTPPAVTLLNAPTSSQSFTTSHRGPSSMAPFLSIMTFELPTDGTGTNYAYSLPDTMPASGPIPAAFPIYEETLQAPSKNDIAFLPLSTAEMFMAITLPPVMMTYSLGVGIATSTAPLTSTGLTSVATSSLEDDVGRPDMFQANGNVYIFDQNDESSTDESSPGLSTWTVPDTAQFTAAPTRRTIESPNPSFIFAIDQNVADTANPSADVLYEETTTDNGFTTSVTFRAGTIPFTAPDAGASDLATWTSTDLSKVDISTSVYATPVGTGTASVWVNDNMLLGAGLKNGTTGIVMNGLNMVWVDSTGKVRGQQMGANNLLQNLDDFASASAAPISIGATSARWAIAYVETKTDDAGSYDVVEYNELDCQSATAGDGGGDGSP